METTISTIDTVATICQLHDHKVLEASFPQRHLYPGPESGSILLAIQAADPTQDSPGSSHYHPGGHLLCCHRHGLCHGHGHGHNPHGSPIHHVAMVYNRYTVVTYILCLDKI